MVVHFEKANINHKEVVLTWLQESHVQEFWDNSQEHKDDILQFIEGRKVSSSYFGGIFNYWVGIKDRVPCAFIATSDFDRWNRQSFSSKGKTVSMDFMIGNVNDLDQGLAAPILEAFMTFYRTSIDPEVAIFFTDPAVDDYKSQHICQKIGFRKRKIYVPTEGYFKGGLNMVMTRKVQ